MYPGSGGAAQIAWGVCGFRETRPDPTWSRSYCPALMPVRRNAAMPRPLPAAPRLRSIERVRGAIFATPFLLLVGLGIGASPVRASVEIEDIPFPDRVVAGDSELRLHGLGLLRYRILFRGYVGALYLPSGTNVERTLDDIPKSLELYYFWDIEGRFFGEAANELLARNLPPERIAALRERLDQLHALYKDVEAGDRYRLTYLPGTGMTLSHNGQELGTIPGADFATDYFGIWLGENPLNESFRDQLFKGH